MSGGIVYSVEKHARKNRMSDEQYEAMVEAAQELALRDYKGYRVRVILLAALGYAFCLTFVGIFIVLGAFFIKMLIASKAHYFGIKGAIAFGALAFIMIKAMWVRMPPLEGRPVTREEAPALFELIDDLSSKLNARIDVVMLNEDFNCAVEQRPRLGLLGWSTNALHLGLPMMASFTPEQFSAVLAHEMGHLSGNHGTLSMLIYRLSLTWNRVLDQLRGDSPIIYALFFVFANWYMPIFGAYTFSLRRKHEQDADESAAQLVGAKPAAEAHIRSALIGQYLDKVFWERIRNLPKTQSEAPRDLFQQMVRELQHLKISDEQGHQWLREELEHKSNLDDPHPCSRERIDVLQCPQYNSRTLLDTGVPPELLDIRDNAADRYLGTALVAELAKHYSDNLYEVWKEGWQAQYNEYEQTRKEYAELEDKRKTTALDSDDMLKLATAIRDLHSIKEAMPIVDEAMARFPDESWPYAVKGMTLVADKDESGIPLVEKAILMDTRYLESGCQSLIAYYEQKGRKDLVKKYVKKLDDFEDVKDLAREERYNVKPSDHFEPATLPSELLEKLRSQIADYTDVDEALIARKQVQHLPEFPHYVIAIKPKFSFNADERNIELINTLSQQLQFEESFCVTVIDHSKKKIEHKLKEISDEPLYSRKGSKN